MNNGIKIAWRIVVIVFCGFFMLAILLAGFATVTDWIEYGNLGQDIEDYDYILYEGDYGVLRRRLGDYNPEGDEFQVYWDIADAYAAYTQYDFWKQVLTEEDQSAERKKQAQIYCEEERERLEEIYERSGEVARKHIINFAGDLIS